MSVGINNCSITCLWFGDLCCNALILLIALIESVRKNEEVNKALEEISLIDLKMLNSRNQVLDKPKSNA